MMAEETRMLDIGYFIKIFIWHIKNIKNGEWNWNVKNAIWKLTIIFSIGLNWWQYTWKKEDEFEKYLKLR